MTYQIEPLTPVIGAEVTGLDLRSPLDDETIAALRADWLRHLVLVFRDQDLTEAQQVRFAGYFGAAHEVRQDDNRARRPDADPRVMLISNIRENGELIGTLPGGELQFHSDSAFLECPLMATVLYGVTITERGGSTKFANMYAVLDALAPELRERLEGLGAINVFDFITQVKTARLDRETAVNAVHPVIRTHPETARKALYVNRLMTEDILELPRDESDTILAGLFDLLERPEFGYEHIWRPGDLLIWDNRCAQHARTDYPAEEARLLRRVGIEGDRPY